MKKITLLLITLFISLTGFSQALLQGFETPTTPFGVPANWARFEIGSPQELWATYGTITSIAPRTGTKQAAILGENLGSGNSAKYYLATPKVTIPLNGQLRFWVRTKTQGDQGGVFKVKVASGALPANQTTEAAYTTTLQTYSESQISTNIAPAPIVYEEKVIDFPPATYPAGTEVYIAFVSEVNQTSLFQVDDFFLDDVLVVSRCLEPGTLPTGIITSTSAVLNWSNPNPTSGLGLNICNEWEIEIVPATQLTPTGSGLPVNTNPYTATTLTAAPFAPLLPLTQYKYWIRSKCFFSGSIWSGPFTFTTAPGPPVCGGNYVDAGGLTGNYPNGVTATNGGTSVITPVVAGDAVTVTFRSFVTAESTDRLRVFNGTVATGTPIGTFSGTLTGVNLPGPFTSSDPSGALTFVFTSDGSLNAAGWLADITCAPIPTCTTPNTLTSSTITANTASIGWFQPQNPNLSTANAWQCIALPCGSTAPTATSTGWQAAPSNPFVVTGLTAGTCYDIYVRAVCSTTDVSAWSFRPVSVTTRPGCGGPFFDPGGTSNYANNITAATGTTTICPSIPGQVVTVTFNTFATESGRDLLKVYDGDTSAGILLGTFSGTAIPGPFTAASTTGCLTFVFTSDTSLANSGWDASVTCGPRPPCAKPTTLTATAVTQSTALLGWTQPTNPDGSNATAWQVSAVPCGSGVPAIGSSSWVNANSNPFYITGLASSTCYEYYVRAVCSSTESSSIAGPFSFNTLIVNDECTGAIEIPVNQNTNCLQTVQGSLAFATGSTNASSCDGTLDDDDVWFSFTATSTSHFISLLGVNYSATPTGLKYSIFSGSCGALTQIGGCITNSTASPNPSLDGLTVGATYYIKVYSSGTTPVTTTFEICVGTNVGTCATALPLCAITPIIIPNNVGVPTLPNPISPYSSTSTTVGCLGSAPSPTFYYFQVPTSGNYTFFLEQNTSNTFATATGIDVDFVAWGPFNTNAEACASISTTTAPPNFGISCSFSAAATENFGVNNAVAGQIYVIMITNYNGRKGFVRISQTAGPAPIECCPFGNFSYPKNFYCQNEANPTPRFISNAIAGTFSAVPATGLSINPVTGLINLATSTPGTYIVHNVIGANGTCPSDDDSWSITISAPPSGAAINYNSTSYCILNTTVQNITQSGTPGGVFTVAPALGLSLNTTTGSFNPSTSTLGTYVVSYNLPQSGGCPGAISSTTVNIVLPVPTFNPARPICVGGTSDPLPTTSLNGISGTWSPAINNSATTTYTFTPNAGQCGTTTTMTIEVGPVSPGFTQIAPICTGATLAALPNTSLNGVTGTWSPALSNTATTTYTFTPTPGAGFCSTNATMTITVNPLSITPTFLATAAICNGATIAPLPTTSINGITGTWSPALNNTATTTYTFTPDPGQCAFTATKTITVNPAFAVTVNSTSVCSGTTATVTATPSVAGTYTYTWTVPSGATNPGNFASFNPTVSGAYTVVLSQLGCNSVPAISNVLITTIRTPTFVAIPTLCQNSVAPVLPSSSTNTPPVTGTWNNTINTANLGATSYTFTPAANQCATSTTISVTIAASPVASFSYNSTTYCKTGANPGLTLGNGSAAGVFTSTTGLSLNSSTGAINLSASTPGNYTITNTIAPTASCPGATATFALTITAAPIASFNYDGSPYCKTGTNPSPTFTGGSAGTFTSTPGLIINSTTGQIDLAASTAGSYLVTNTIVAANGCSQVQFTSGVIITAAPVASFSYNSATYCKSGANPVITITGSAGVFTSTTGLSLNSSTGAIDLSLSSPGNYTITNTIAAASGCNAVSATFVITITAPQAATFSYTGSPYCKNATNPSPSLAGSAAGTFTSTTGLSINATTGVINLAASTAGIYTVTNTIAASGGCPAVVATAQVTITNLPAATIAYSDTFYCFNNTASQTVTLTGTTGGTFSAAPSGLSISAASGAFNVSNSTAGSYTITYTMAATGGCPLVTATTTLTIIPQINVQLSAVCNGPDFTITALPVSGSFNPSNATYEWTGPNGFIFGPTSNPSIVISTPGNYISTVIVNGCRFVTSQQVDGVTCSIQKGISPNGDGDNEDFILSDVKALSIFNRYGTKVYTYGQNYTNQWHGQSESGSELPDGTYYYVITRNSGNSITGWIYINR